jgi:endo-1,4-beta-xylanase
VVYFLHGAGGTETSDAGGFSGLLAKEIEARRIPPVICVFPNGGMSGYADRPEQKVMMETFLIRELIPEIDRSYRTIAMREGRSLCGFSMGGGGAIRLAVKYPDLFCAAGSWAAALGSRGGESASDLAQKNAEKIRGRVKLLLIVGDKDQTYPGHVPVLKTLEELKIPYTYHELAGVGHDLGAYYEKTGTKIARFVAGFGEK